MKAINNLIKIVLIVIFAIAVLILPTSVLAATNYNTTLQADREKIQQIIPNVTFNGNIPSIGIERGISKGESVYFENVHQWNDVRIYVFGNGELASYPGIEMTKTNEQINGHDIYKYTYNGDNTGYGKLIISGTNSNNERKQTIDLSFYQNNIIFTPNSDTTSDGKYEGWWYYYDKTELTHYANIAKTLAEYKTLFDKDLYAAVEGSIATANDIIASATTKVNFYYEDSSTFYMDDYSESLYSLTTNLSKLKLNSNYIAEEIKKGEEKKNYNLTADDRQKLEEAVKSAQEVLTQITQNPNLFNLNPATSLTDATSQSNSNSVMLAKLADAINTIESIKAIGSTNNPINGILTNPQTASITYAIIFIGIILIVSLVSFAMYSRKNNKNNNKDTK